MEPLSVHNNVGKIFILGDLHFGVRNNALAWRDDQVNFIHEFIKDLPKHGFNPDTDMLFMLGDIFHSRESVNVMIRDYVMNVFAKLNEKFKNGIYIILGNHDVYYNDRNDINSLNRVGAIFKNVHVVWQPTIMKINEKFNFLMLPWITDPIKASDMILKCSDTCDYMCAHLDINEFLYGSGVPIKNGVGLDAFRKYKRVYSGHIHLRQENDNILYVGTPYHLDRNDIGNDKGYYILNLNDDGIDEIFVENKKSPRFVKFNMEDVLNTSIDKIKEMFNNNYVDIHTDINIARSLNFKMLIDYIKKNGSTHRKIECPTYVTEVMEQETNFNITGDFNLINISKSLLESRKFRDNEISDILDYFQELHKKAKI